MYEASHYQNCTVTFTRKYQPIDAIRNMPFSLGCAFKYLCRAGYKGDIGEDYQKAMDYLIDFRDNLGKKCYRNLHLNRDAKQALLAFIRNTSYLRALFGSWYEAYLEDHSTKVYVGYQDISDALDLLNKFFENKDPNKGIRI